MFKIDLFFKRKVYLLDDNFATEKLGFKTTI